MGQDGLHPYVELIVGQQAVAAVGAKLEVQIGRQCILGELAIHDGDVGGSRVGGTR